MKEYQADKIRTVAFVSHGGSGKTSMAEALIFDSGAATRIGKVDDGSSLLDFEEEEKAKKMSLFSAIAPIEWNGYKINIIDVPGFPDFFNEVIAAMRVAEGLIVPVSAIAGVEVQTELIWEEAGRNHKPRIVFVNKMDRENVEYKKVVNQLAQMFGANCIPIQLPIGQAESFSGVVDIVHMKAYSFENGAAKEIPIPDDMKSDIDEALGKVIEAAAEGDDTLLEKYLDGQDLTGAEIIKGLKSGVATGTVFPVVFGSAGKNIGLATLLDEIINYIPDAASVPAQAAIDAKSKEAIKVEPDPNGAFAGLIFKTIIDPFVGKLSMIKIFSGSLNSDSHVMNVSHNKDERIGQLLVMTGKKQDHIKTASLGDIVAVAKLIDCKTNDTLSDPARTVLLEPIEFMPPVASHAIESLSKGDEDKLGTAFGKIIEGDPGLSVRRDNEVRQTIVSGMGEAHLDMALHRLKDKYNVEARYVDVRIPYRETITGKSEVQGKHKKQSGGHGQYGDCKIRMEPNTRGAGFEFVDQIFGGSIPKQYIPAVEKGIVESMDHGVLAGYKTVDIKVTLYDGSYHPVDSSEMAFKLAGTQAFKKGTEEANPVLLEPIMNLEVRIPDNFMGDIMGDVNSKRGKIMGTEQLPGGVQLVKAQVPQAELAKYANDLRSITQGRGLFKMEFSHYEEIPAHLAAKLIEAAKKEKAEH